MRAAGTPGDRASVDYVARRLREAGWTVRLQPVRFPYFDLRRASMSIGGRKLRAGARLPGAELLRRRAARTGACDGWARAARPTSTPALAAGDVPLVSRGGCFFREKALHAQRAGARALVVIDDSPTRRGVPSGTLAVPGIRIPVVLVSDALARDGAACGWTWTRRRGAAATHNVIAETPGGDGDRVVMAGGHLDSVRGRARASTTTAAERRR